MREILFRGKSIDDGEWIYGDLLHKHFRNETKATKVIRNNLTIYKVVPETIGQYTGLTDKNGRKIIEGDILAFADRIAEVEWNNICGCWDCRFIKLITGGEQTISAMRAPSKWGRNAEVIGNIHDNPELLKGGAE